MTQKPLNNTPARRLIERFGVKSLALWTERHHSRVHAWSWPVAKGGTGGVVPVRLRGRIIEGALRDYRVVVTPADFELAPGETYSFEVAA